MRLKIFGKTVIETENNKPATVAPIIQQPSAVYEMGISRRILTTRFNGEKNLGELGPIRRYALDHDALRLRSWQLYLESEICQTVIKRFSRWVIGKGLKLQAEPQTEVLISEKINIDPEKDFNNLTEARFRVFANSKMSDYSNKDNLHKIAKRAFINSRLGGDVLVILRYINKEVKVQLVDGAHIATPYNLAFKGTDYISANGNRVRWGIEIDACGEPVAYYVRTGTIPYVYERIPARGPKSGALMAFMVYGLEYRLDNLRGIPLLSAVMETAKKMERYKEATLGSAEEVAKMSYAIEHDIQSSGENPLLERAAEAFDVENTAYSDLAKDINGKALASKVMATTNKQVVNLTPGSKLVTLTSENELHFRDFFTVNVDLVCATVDIPPNVAMGKYDSNFSASRAALKDWEHTLDDERKGFSDQFYAPIYWFWLETQILENKIQAPGYIQAIKDGNNMAIEAYRYARFEGAKVPHIDPEKEVRAERLKLGEAGQATPLTTNEAATENVSEGDYESNVKQFAREIKEAKAAGIEAPPQGTLQPAKIKE